jgi:predicted Zn-dependent protease
LLGIAVAEHTLNKPRESQQALDELIAKHAGDSAYQIAMVYAWRGERDKAFEWLDRGYAQRDNGLVDIKWDPLMNSLHADPRYKALLRKINLPD